MSRPRILDLFSGAGGAAMGYHRAGFDVVGVDIRPMPRYPFEHIVADALEVLADRKFVAGFDAVHASPPCQAYSMASVCRPGLAAKYPALIGPARDLLQRSGLPYVIENVPGAPLRDPMMLCGFMFGLDLYRHRYFEFGGGIIAPLVLHPPHTIMGSFAGHWKPGTIISVAGNCAPIALARRVMGIEWMTRDELAEAIPPAFAAFVGAQLLDHIRAGATA